MLNALGNARQSFPRDPERTVSVPEPPAALASILSSAEFLSAIAGAVVGAVAGGLIAYIIQAQALREARRQRNEDHKRTQQGLGHSLLFKMVRILSDFHGIHQHFENSFEDAGKKGFGGDDPWSFVLPLANPPEPIHFAADEMGMLLAQKDDDTFNSVLPMDIVHNSLIEVLKVFNAERRALGERLRPEEVNGVNGAVVTGVMDRDEALALRPRMIEVNGLINSLRTSARTDFQEANEALNKLSTTLREKLGLRHKLELLVDIPKEPRDTTPDAGSHSKALHPGATSS
jgi:hypothetical protein